MISNYKQRMKEPYEAPQKDEYTLTLFNTSRRSMISFPDGFEYVVAYYNDISTPSHIGTGELVYVDEADNKYYSFNELKQAIKNGEFVYSNRYVSREIGPQDLIHDGTGKFYPAREKMEVEEEEEEVEKIENIPECVDKLNKRLDAFHEYGYVPDENIEERVYKHPTLDDVVAMEQEKEQEEILVFDKNTTWKDMMKAFNL